MADKTLQVKSEKVKVKNGIPDGWKITKLGEVAEGIIDNRGKTPPITNSGYELLEVNAISENQRTPDYSKVTKFVDQETFNNWFRTGNISADDILIPTVGTIGNVSYSKLSRGSIAQNLIALRSDRNKTEPLFVYYLLKAPYYKNQLLKLDIGGVQPSIKVPHLLGLEVDLPPLPEQRAIAAVLSSFDDKIELLREQNKTLEAIAQAIFKEWFVNFNFPCELKVKSEKLKGKTIGYKDAGGKMIDSELGPIPEGWRVGKLEDEFDIAIGRTPPRMESVWFLDKPMGKKWISIKDIGNSEVYISNTAEYLTDEAIEKFNIPIIPENTAVLSFKMTVGKLAITTEEMLSNEAIAHLKINSNTNLSTEYIYLFLKGLDFNSLGSTSSIVTAINSTMIKMLDVLVPDDRIMKNFNAFIQPIFAKLKNNNSQIQTLSKLRDSLLPKLMKGEVRVKSEKLRVKN